MKSSLRRLRGFATHKHSRQERRPEQRGLPTQQEELHQASQDMLDMRNCYDSLLCAAAATANSAYEFSEALRELGTCLLEKTALNDNEEIGKVLLMLGKEQFELQKFVDSYRIHIHQTITTPSESLLKELQNVEEMKCQCDEKRDLCKSMMMGQGEKGRVKDAKGETFSLQQLQAARDDFQDEATLFLFRLKSLKQGQSRSLLTQAARHHAAQLNFFRKGVRSLEAVEPHLRVVAEQQHIDYQFSGLKDDDLDQSEDDSEDEDYDDDHDGELSFDYGQIDQGQRIASISRKSMELDQADQTSTQVSTSGFTKASLDRNQEDFVFFNRKPDAVSLSAPLLVDKNRDLLEKTSQTQHSSTKKYHTYVLPTPLDVKNSSLTGSGHSVSAHHMESKGGFPTQLRHSSSLHSNMPCKDMKDVGLPNPSRLPNSDSVLKESNTNDDPVKSPPFHQGIASRLSPPNSSDAKKIKVQAFSGPLTGVKRLPTKVTLSATDSMSSVDNPYLFAVKPTNVPTPQASMHQKVSPNASPPVSSPGISELHELPRPPVGLGKVRRPSLVAHSAPLVPRGQNPHVTNKHPSVSSYTASPLPPPPGAMARSFSIPSSGQRTQTITAAKLEAPHAQARPAVYISSPPAPTLYKNS